jgi:dTDP-4-dehydrorhamnose reductase
MAGHVITTWLRETTKHQVYTLARRPTADPSAFVLDVQDEAAWRRMIKEIRPDTVINAVGILNRRAEERPAEAIYINSLLPHKLAETGDVLGFRVIHISTDCVFSGKRGGYTETDLPDGTTMYARTKILGEIRSNPHVTVRTSIVGPEMKSDGIGLFHWFMRQHGDIEGYTRVWWNGVTTLELSNFIRWLLQHPLSGLVHLHSPKPVCKHDLLGLFQAIFQKNDVKIRPNPHIQSDKTLVSMRTDIDYTVPELLRQIREMRNWIEQHRTFYHYPPCW